MNKVQNRISKFINSRHVNIKELAARFFIDSNIHTIKCIITDADPDYVKTEEVTVTKKSGSFVITHEIGRYEPFYGTETEIRRSFTRNVKTAKTLLSKVLDWEEVRTLNSRGRDTGLHIVRFADK